MPMNVVIPGGNQIKSTPECQKLKWKINGETFESYMVLLPLGGCEMVLGIQWLWTLGDIKWNFEALTMLFTYKGKRIKLRGMRKSMVQWLNGKKTNKSVGSQQAHLNAMYLCVYPTTLCSMDIDVQKEEKQSEGLTILLNEFNDIFEVPTSLPPKRTFDHRIPLKEGTQPLNIRPYRHPQPKRMRLNPW
ncbi:uncharacterized protein [Rutidosis leptorrhynchoides]|uniref:uncharacterized protein n=1 Tax=Rutidosis leptorrhynchoides TaxID=125765 RepID=UPI003A992381